MANLTLNKFKVRALKRISRNQKESKRNVDESNTSGIQSENISGESKNVAIIDCSRGRCTGYSVLHIPQRHNTTQLNLTCF